MRIAFITDIHANLPALEAVIADAREHKATHLLCLGDIVGYGPQPIETLARIRNVASGVLLGNHDAAAAEILDLNLFNPFARETAERAILALDEEAKQYLRGLPHLLEVKNIACAHGCFDAPETFRYLETEEDAARNLDAMPNFNLLVVGHTHIPRLFVRESPESPVRQLPVADTQLLPGHRYIVNPGSVGFPRSDQLTADYLIYDTLMRRLIFRSVHYNIAPYRMALVRNGYNPLHYWFLSPSARKRQAELALCNPAPQKTTVFDDDSPFRPVPKRTPINTIFLAICIALCVILISLITVVLLQPDTTNTTANYQLFENSNNILSPLEYWDFTKCESVSLSLSHNEITFNPSSTQADYRLHSPLYQLNTNTKQLRLSFQTKAGRNKVGVYSVRAEFIDRNGARKYGRVHEYKTIGLRSYTIKVPKEATGIRILFSFTPEAPITLISPKLEVVNK